MGFLKGLNKDYYGGALMILVGLSAAYAGSHYRIGTLSRMGPGFFPTSLGVLLTAVGAAIALGASLTNTQALARFPFDPRACSAILGGLIAWAWIEEPSVRLERRAARSPRRIFKRRFRRLGAKR